MKKYFCIFIALVTLAAVGCSQTVEQKIAEQLKLGEKLLIESSYEEAVIAFRKVIELEPKYIDAYLGLAEAYRGLGKDTHEMATLEDAMQVISDSYDVNNTYFISASKVMEQLANLYVQNEYFNKAEDVVNMAEQFGINISYEYSKMVEETSAQSNQQSTLEESSPFDDQSEQMSEMCDALEMQYGIASPDSFISCESSDIKTIPQAAYGILAEQVIEDGKLVLLRSAQTESPSHAQIIAEIYSKQDGNIELATSSRIDTSDYSMASLIYMYYSEMQNVYKIVVDYASMGAYTGFDEYGVSVYSIREEGIESAFEWRNAGSPAEDNPESLDSYMESSDIPYLKNCIDYDNRESCASYYPLCEIEHEVYYDSGEWDYSYIGRNHRLRFAGNLLSEDKNNLQSNSTVNNTSQSEMLTTDEAYQIARSYWNYSPGDVTDDGYELYMTEPYIMNETNTGKDYYFVRLQWYVDDPTYPHMSTIDQLYIDAVTGEYYYSLPQDRTDVGDDQFPGTYTSDGIGYILPQSSSRLITRAEIAEMDDQELKIARNEIYARHGRRFRDLTLQSYFDSCTWYNGTISPDMFNEEVLNEYEKSNIKTIQDYERERGYIQ